MARKAISSSGAEGIRIDASELSALLDEAKAFEGDLLKRMRKRIKEAAAPAVSDVKSAAKKVPAKPPHGDVRALVAKGVGLRTVNRQKTGTAAIRISALSKNLPPERKLMVRLLNKTSWRHPTFRSNKRIDRGRWVTQKGKPYFEDSILEHRDEFVRAIERALDDAASEMGRTRRR